MNEILCRCGHYHPTGPCFGSRECFEYRDSCLASVPEHFHRCACERFSPGAAGTAPMEALTGYRVVGDEKWLLRENASAIGPETMTELEIKLWNLVAEARTEEAT